MLTLYDASTTISKDKTEYFIPAYETQFDEELIDLDNFKKDLVSVFTNLSIEDHDQSEFMDAESALIGNYDLISKFQFMKSKVITVRIKKTKFIPSVVID